MEFHGISWGFMYNGLLVGGIPIYPSEKYEFVSWDDEIPNIYRRIWKNKKCSKP
jgi:hypothetical protein